MQIRNLPIIILSFVLMLLLPLMLLFFALMWLLLAMHGGSLFSLCSMLSVSFVIEMLFPHFKIQIRNYVRRDNGWFEGMCVCVPE